MANPIESNPARDRIKKRERVALIGGLIVLALVVLVAIFSPSKPSGEEEKQKFEALTKEQQDSVLKEKEVAEKEKAAEERKKKILSLLSEWDGSNIAVTMYLKKNLNDPESYEHIETKIWDMGDHAEILTKFRAKNAFGAKIINYAKASVTLDNELIEIKLVD